MNIISFVLIKKTNCVSLFPFYCNTEDQCCFQKPPRRSFNVFSIFIPSVRKTLLFQKKIKVFNVQFMVLHVAVQMKDNLIVFVDMRARLNAVSMLVGMHSNIRQATSHKAVEMFLKFFVFPFPDDTAR